jgi:hypothetical protein
MFGFAAGVGIGYIWTHDHIKAYADTCQDQYLDLHTKCLTWLDTCGLYKYGIDLPLLNMTVDGVEYREG